MVTPNDANTEEEVEFDVPDEAVCPECGGEPTDESERERFLSDMGYMSGECPLVCGTCGSKFLHGVPLGEFDLYDDMECPACSQRGVSSYFRVHRVHVDPPDPPMEFSEERRRRVLDMENPVLLHVKCPECFHMPKGGGVYRDADDYGLALVGNPPITGETDGARPQGYRE